MHGNHRLTSFSQALDYAAEGPLFTGKVLMGEARTEIDVVYDTGSDWLSVPDVTCLECEGQVFDASLSSPVDPALDRRVYGSARLLGSTFSDQVCLNWETDSCLDSFEFFSFTEQVGLAKPIEGMLGLSQKHQSTLAEEEHTLGPLFVLELAKAGNINQGEFSFALNSLDLDSSFVDFGPPVAARVEGGDLESLVTLQFNEDFYWSTSWQGIQFAEGDGGFAVENDLQYAIFDSGTAHLFFPESSYDRVMSHLLKEAGNPEHFLLEGVTFLECYVELDFKPLWLMFDGHWLRISPQDYIFDVQGDGSLCMLLILKNSYDFFIVGQPALRGYYAAHNMRLSTIGFAPLAGSGNEPLRAGTVPTKSMKMAKDRGAAVAIIAVVGYFTVTILIYNYAYNPWLLFTFTPWFESTFGITLPQIYVTLFGKVAFFLVLILAFYFGLLPLLGVETGKLNLLDLIAGLIV